MSHKGKETKPPKYCNTCEETVSRANWSRHIIRRHHYREEESQSQEDMDDLSPSRVFYLRRCAARLGILFCTGHSRSTVEESVSIRDHVLSRSDQRICVEVADSIMTTIRSCFARATFDYPISESADVLGVQARRPVHPSSSTISKPAATVSTAHGTLTAEGEPDLTSELEDEETAAPASVSRRSLEPTATQDIEMEVAASGERMANRSPSSQGSLIEPSQIPKERLAMRYATKKKKKLAEPRQGSKEKSKDIAPVSNAECSMAEGVDVFIAPEEEELEEEEDNPLASCLPDAFNIRKSSQVPVTSTASHTVESSIPESQSVRPEPTTVLSEKRVTQHVEKQSFGREHTAPESTPAVKPRESKSKSHAWSSATASRKSSPPRKLHEESKIPLRKRRQRSPTPESRR